MNFKTSILILLIATSCGSSRNESAESQTGKLSVIPKPVSMNLTDDFFELDKNSAVYSDGGAEVEKIAASLASKIKDASGIEIKTGSGSENSRNIYLSLSANDSQLGDEGYILRITSDSLKLSANKPAGLFYGTQTILQLLPVEKNSKWQIPTGTIRDYPEYKFRSSMLDVSRHFFGVEDVKRYIDFLAMYKMNHLHLHLSDDQGWRIEIKSWPNLTAHGGKTEVGGGDGGFYTQEQYTDLVNYAAEKFITIIPEIDMPGHTNAALASYPELNCNKKAPELYTGIEVGFSTLCTGSEITYKFIDDVVRELAAITPGPYLHLGGDESHATKKEDYLPFIERVQGIVEKHNKLMIGWEEAAQANLKPSTIVQHWASTEFATMAAQKGAKVILSPAKKVYLDMKYDSTTKIGLDWAARIEVDSSYNWDPATRVPGLPKENILGIEAPLWSETVTTMDEIEYLVFPRLLGVAELGWTPAESRQWDEYKVRLGNHAPRLRAMDINFYESKLVTWAK
jgi:hexosaminidase